MIRRRLFAASTGIRFISAFFCTIQLLGSAFTAIAQTAVYDLSADFSTNNNPAGQWSYGWKGTLSGSFNLLPNKARGSGENGVPLFAWVGPVSPSAVFFNPSSSTATSDGGQGNFPPGTVWFYPGIEGNPDNYGVIRFTVPSALGGNYQLENRVQSYLDGSGSGDTDYHVMHNGVEIFGQFVPPGSGTGLTNVLVLAGGDTVDFAVGRGEDGMVNGSGLKIQATLTFVSTNPVPPIILTDPQSQTAFVGDDATFNVSAVGSPPLWYQWLYDGDTLDGKTNSALVITNVQMSDAGFYSVIVSNAHGAVTSQVAELTVTLPPPAVLLRGPYLQMATPTSIKIRWRTDEATDSLVRYGLTADNLNRNAANPGPTTEHEVEVRALVPDTRYFYSIGSEEGTLASGTNYYFVTHPRPGQPKPTRIWAIGDCGTATLGGDQIVVRNAYYAYAGSRQTDVWLALGDNAYYNGTDGEYQVNFFDVYPALLRNTILWSTMGNHETYGPGGPGNYAYHNIFSHPRDAEAGGMASGTENYYSFDYANIHFVCLDSEDSIFDPSQRQQMLTWLESDLSANTNEWVIAFWHSPPYTKGSHDSDSVGDSAGRLFMMRTNVVPILESFGVDLVLCGHSHSYERSYLLRGHYGLSQTFTAAMARDAGSGRPNDTGPYIKSFTGTATNDGIVYIVAGSSGWATGLQPDGPHPAMYTTLLRVGSMVIDIDGNTLDAKFLRETGAIDDYFTIVKAAGPEPVRFKVFRVADGTAIARWKSVAGQTYRIDSATSLESPDWSAASADITATGATTSWTNTVGGASKRFYRVALVSP